MIVIPAIDLRGGRCVRLLQGDYRRETVYSEDPVQQALAWEAAGAPMLHLVDLDGARDGSSMNRPIVRAICEAVRIPCELGGGIRSMDDAKRAFELGVERVILGTAICEDPHSAEDFADRFGSERIVAGIDARNGKVAVRGWLETSQLDAFSLAKTLYLMGVNRIIYTDIATDGVMTGPNYEAVRMLCNLLPDCKVIASGGVAKADDVRQLSLLNRDNLEGVIVGKALYDGCVEYRDLIEAAK